MHKLQLPIPGLGSLVRDCFSPATLGRPVVVLNAFALAVSGAIAQEHVKAGFGTMAGVDVLHPNGRVFDQVLMTGPNVTIAADPGQVVRVSFTDPDQDIVQVEFSGSGTVTVQLDPATYEPPAPPQKYNQPGVAYVQGRAHVRVANAAADTFLSVFSVGRGNAVNQALFPAGMIYDAMADISLVEVSGQEMGAILTGNARYSGTAGGVGIEAPDTSVRYRVVVGEISAHVDATPLLRLGAGSLLEWDAGAALVAGGQLQSPNSMPIDASSGAGTPLARINAVNGTRSDGQLIIASTITQAFASKQPGQITINGLSRSTRGYVPASFNDLLNELGYDVFDFGAGTSVQFSGGDTGTYVMAINDVIEGEAVRIQLNGTYSYIAGGTNHSRLTFSLTFGSLSLTSASVSFNGTVYDLSRAAGEPVPARVTAIADFESFLTGTATITVLYTNNSQESTTVSFDENGGLDFGFL